MVPRWLWFNHVPPGLEVTPQQKADVHRLVREMGPGQRRFSDLSRRAGIFGRGNSVRRYDSNPSRMTAT